MSGNACGACGCVDYVVLSQSVSWGIAFERRRCDYCHRVWRGRQPPKKKVVVVKPPDPPKRSPARYRAPIEAPCPKCRSRDTRVASSRADVRWHLCRECGERFKTRRASSS